MTARAWHDDSDVEPPSTCIYITLSASLAQKLSSFPFSHPHLLFPPLHGRCYEIKTPSPRISHIALFLRLSLPPPAHELAY